MTIPTHICPTLMKSLHKSISVLAFVCTLTIAFQSSRAQTFTVIHNFTGREDGGQPEYVAINPAGVLYGTTALDQYGTVFKLNQTNSSWVLSTLFAFNVYSGTGPGAPAVSTDGTLYGAASSGGQADFGTAYILRPPPGVCRSISCNWTQTVIHEFMGNGDGIDPSLGPPLLDRSGNVYGTTGSGGAHIAGTVYELTSSGGSWTESILYSFTGRPNAANPLWNVVPDGAGNFYGVGSGGGTLNWGSLFELSPSGSGWTESLLYSFQPNSDVGLIPSGGLARDAAGNLYGTTTNEGPYGYGTVFEFSPFNGGTISPLYAFSSYGSTSALTIGPDGGIYGTSDVDGLYSKGAVFKLTHTSSGWTYTSLHDFTGGSDGGYPYCNVVFDSSGNLYGTALEGGTYQNGVVWQITP